MRSPIRPGTEWATQPETPAASVPGKAVWPQRIEEGWLKLTPAAQANDGKQ